jgi:type II secretory pathway pseudopilin PulG
VPRHVNRRGGISLLEAVVGLAIVGMTSVAALGAAAAELRAVARSRRALEAAALATDRLGALGFLSGYELLALPDSVEQGRFDPPLDEYRWRTTAAAREGEEGVYDVAVRVEWEGGAYTVHSAVYRRPVVVAP